MTLHERLDADDENDLDRRKVSETSQRRIAECIHHGDVEGALACLFEVATGDEVDEWLPPVRDAEGTLAVSEDVDLADNQRAVVEITVGDETVTRTVREGSGYRVRELSDGEYDVGAIVTAVREYDDEYLEVTEYDVTEYALDATGDSVTVDSTETPIGESAAAPALEITHLDWED